MAKVNHIIGLNTDDLSEDIWKELFSDQEANFSEWVRLKLFEEKQKRGDKDYIYKKLAEAENEIAYWKKQLSKAEESEMAKLQKKKAEAPIHTIAELEIEINKKASTFGMLLGIHFIVEKLPERKELDILAEEYIRLPEENKPKPIDFLVSKGYKRKQIHRSEVTL